MYKHVGKPVFFIVVLVIAALCYVTAFGIRNPITPYSGDTANYWFKGVNNLKLGIDINGGIDVTFVPANNYNATDEELAAATSIINQRLDDQNITDRYVTTDTANDRIIVRIPLKNTTWASDPEAAIEDLGATAELKFKDEDGNEIMTGSDVTSAEAKSTSGTSIKGKYYVELTLKSSGKTKFATATKNLVGKTIGIYMDNTEIDSPTVKEEIDSDTCVIESTSFTAASAKELASKINAGALPFTLSTKNINYISATLGTHALNITIVAGIVAFILVCLFMLIYYRLPGFIACICLAGQVGGIMFVMLIPAFDFTLTLPGIAGIILSIGMGVDCNIITAERIKEELRDGRTLDSALDQGFDRSFSAIFDGNITVIIVGIILMWKGSSSIMSFGFSLIAGVVFNFLMGVTATRLMLKSVSKYDGLRKNSLYGRFAK